jgi:hypothetical protein
LSVTSQQTSTECGYLTRKIQENIPGQTPDLPGEALEDINDREEVEDDEMGSDQDSGAANPTWEPVYPTPKPFLTDISLSVGLKG